VGCGSPHGASDHVVPAACKQRISCPPASTPAFRAPNAGRNVNGSCPMICIQSWYALCHFVPIPPGPSLPASVFADAAQARPPQRLLLLLPLPWCSASAPFALSSCPLHPTSPYSQLPATAMAFAPRLFIPTMPRPRPPHPHRCCPRPALARPITRSFGCMPQQRTRHLHRRADHPARRPILHSFAPSPSLDLFMRHPLPSPPPLKYGHLWQRNFFGTTNLQNGLRPDSSNHYRDEYAADQAKRKTSTPSCPRKPKRCL